MLHTGDFTKKVREMSSQLFVTLYTLSIYTSAQKQLSRHLPNLFRELSVYQDYIREDTHKKKFFFSSRTTKVAALCVMCVCV